jgi:hypothetical protein
LYAGSSSSATINVRLHDLTSGLLSYVQFVDIGTYVGYSYDSVSNPVALFPVTPGNRTFTIESARDPFATGSTYADNAVITAVFIPFGPGGAIGASEDSGSNGTVQPAAPPRGRDRH